MRPLQPRLLAALLLAGCAAPNPMAGVTPKERPPGSTARPEHDPLPASWWIEDRDDGTVPLLRRNLAGADEEKALFAAINLSVTTLSLPEIHRQMDLLLRHADRVFWWTGRKGDAWWPPGMKSLGSPEVMPLYNMVVAHDPDGTAAPPPGDLHRVTIQDHLPTMAGLLAPARGEIFQRVFWNFRLLADNTDRHHDSVERALHFVRASMLAEASGSPDPGELPIPPAGPGIPESLRLLVRAPWGLGDEPLQGAFFVPGWWIDRWIGRRAPNPADLPFLEEVAWKTPFNGLHEDRRVWAARRIAAVGGPEAARILAELEADGWKVREWLEPEPPDPPEAMTAAEARELAAAWARDPGAVENLRVTGGWPTLLLVEAAAPEALDGLLRTWAAEADPDYRDEIAALRLRRGDPAAVAAFLDRPDASREDYWRIGRSKDPRTRGHLERMVRTGEFDHGYAAAGLALWHGLPEPLAESILGTTAAPDLLLEGKPADWILGIAEAGDFPEDRIARLGLLGAAARPILEKYRRERHLGLYWPATAGLAMAGDPEAREEFLSLLGEDRIGLWDEWFDPVACSLNGDPEALAHWRSRLGANCCLAHYARRVLERWYPTLPLTEPEMLPWWERRKDRLRWSLLADGWVPAAE